VPSVTKYCNTTIRNYKEIFQHFWGAEVMQSQQARETLTALDGVATQINVKT